MDFKEFIVTNWTVILSVVLFILSFICSLVKKRSSSDLMDKLLLEVVNLIPDWISAVEAPGNGADKKLTVLATALNCFETSLGRKLTQDESNYYSSIICNCIESILATPQKKGV